MTKHRINGILLSQGRTFTTRSLWTKAHRSWLEEQREDFDGPLGTVLRMELEHLEYMEAQVNAVDLEIERYARRESYRPLVEALECLRGVKTLTAMTLASEIGDIHRFRSPRALMSWVGLVPSEKSSGDRERRGPITRSGNGHVRRIIIESAWHHRHRAGANLIVQRRRMGKPPAVVAMAVKAQHRLHKRFWRLKARKHPNKVVAAVARELCGFVWAIMKEVSPATA
jgi:transposase